MLDDPHNNGGPEDCARTFQHSLYFEEARPNGSMAGRELQHPGDVAVHEFRAAISDSPFGTGKTLILAGGQHPGCLVDSRKTFLESLRKSVEPIFLFCQAAP